jgi:hypothetical protein
MRATTFKTRATEHVAQRRRSQPNCLRSHDTSTELVFGRIAPRTCNRTRGFLVRDNKTTATVSGASVAWTGIGRCRTLQSDEMYKATPSDTTTCTVQRESCISTFEHYSKLYSMLKARYSILSIESYVPEALYNVQSNVQCTKLSCNNSLCRRWLA